MDSAPTGAHRPGQAVLYREIPATCTCNIIVPIKVSVLFNRDRLPGRCYRRGAVIPVVVEDCHSIVGMAATSVYGGCATPGDRVYVQHIVYMSHVV